MVFHLKIYTLNKVKRYFMISLKEFKSASNAAAVFSKLFHARDFAHYAHLRSKFYAQHKALNSFYDDIVDLADQLYETFAGQYGQQKFEFETVQESDVLDYFENIAKFFMESHSAFDKKDTHLHNIIDEIVSLIYQTIYKLKFLK